MKLDVSIDSLNLTKEVISKLKSISIYTVEDLWKCKRLYLKEQGISDSEIHQIQIQLQLLSLDFGKKIYKV